MVHNFKGKLLLSEDSPTEEQPPNMATLHIGRMESPLEKYIASQVSVRRAREVEVGGLNPALSRVSSERHSASGQLCLTATSVSE